MHRFNQNQLLGAFAGCLLLAACSGNDLEGALLGDTPAASGGAAGTSSATGGQAASTAPASSTGVGEGGMGTGGTSSAAGGSTAAGGAGGLGAGFCVPGAHQSCYIGPTGTEGVGSCAPGSQTCNEDGSAWGPCLGQTLPAFEICDNGVDEDCNGVVDDVVDMDGDGWTVCDGDCCDTPGLTCQKPELVNPGAFEFLDNQVDDDCDPTTSDTEPPDPCSTAADFSDVSAGAVARAMDICATAKSGAPLSEKKWGLLGSTLINADGTEPTASEIANIRNYQTAIMTGYGGNVKPKKGKTMAALSTGRARDEGDPDFVTPNYGTDFYSHHQPPSSYLSHHGGSLPGSAGCSGNCPAGKDANDSVNAKLRIRVPTNAKSFSYNFKFYTAEYKQFACTAYNDFYLALLNTDAGGVPADKNISFDSAHNPVSVNNGFFDVCQPKGCYTCPSGTGELAGTGMQSSGGATKWLTTDAPVVPGEEITLQFMIFDVSDGVLDSLVLLDNFAWKVQASEVGTHQ